MLAALSTMVNEPLPIQSASLCRLHDGLPAQMPLFFEIMDLGGLEQRYQIWSAARLGRSAGLYFVESGPS
jgi:hypothetical protein